MVNASKSLCIFLLSILSSLALADDFQANVDRTNINESDVFTLVLRYNEQVGFGSPDINALSNNFKVLTQQRSNQYRSINGKNESFTQWIISLSPLKTGTLTIPEFEFKGKKTQPIKIEVNAISESMRAQTAQEFFFNVQIEPTKRIYAQQQIIYTEKLYFGTQHSDATLSELKVNNARVQALGDIKQYTTTINGKKFGVYERQMAIFPEKKGELILPSQTFTAQAINPYDRWSRAKPVSASSDAITLQIEAIPSNYPTKAAWLPVKNLAVEESFSSNPDQWKAGEAVTRTFIIKAEGLAGNQLPEIQLPVVDGIRYYPDQIRYKENLTSDGVRGIAEQAVALVATRGGKIVLPEIRIPWWNTKTDRLEYAILPAHTINVKGEAAPLITSEQAPVLKQPIETSSNTSIAAPIESNTWPFSTIMLGIGFFASLILNMMLLMRKKPFKEEKIVEATPINSVKDHWIAFSKAVNVQNANNMRTALLAWVNAGGINGITPVTSLSALMQQISDPRLCSALQELDEHLYSNKPNYVYNANNLKQLLQQAKSTKKIDDAQTLYPK